MLLLGRDDDSPKDRSVRLRPASPTEAATLSALAVRSKASWGYDESFLRACHAELTITPGFIEEAVVELAEVDGEIAGFFSLAPWNSDIEVCHFFVDPAHVGRGVGRLLWSLAAERAAELGFSRVLIQSDPNAEGFYVKLGAERIGEVPSQVQPGRRLPLLLYSLP